MSSRTVQIEWNPPWVQIMAKHSGKMPAAVADLLNRLGVMGVSKAKKLTPVNTGNLRKRITHEVDGTKAYIGTNVTYAPIILSDTPPFVIRPVHKKVLAWTDKGKIRPSSPQGWKKAREKGVAHYAKQVRHPGGLNVIGETADYLEQKIPRVVQQILHKHGIV